MPRYRPTPQSIVAQVRQLRAAPAHAELARALDALDTWGALEDALKAMPRLLAHGPKALQGIDAAERAWVGAAIWRRGDGYHGYKVLTVTGVWAAMRDDAPHVLVGTKYLPFAAPFYEAEAYHKLIRSGFSVYYADDGAPPAAPRYDAPYHAGQRLALRDAIRAALRGA